MINYPLQLLREKKMSEHILSCKSCKKYTLGSSCPSCNEPTIPARPPKFSLNDKYANYKREVKKPELKKLDLY